MSKEFEAAHFHDVVAEILHVKNITNKNLLSDDKLLKIYNKLPQSIRDEAKTFGCADSVFRDNAYVWLSKNWEDVLKSLIFKNSKYLSLAVTTYIKVEIPNNTIPEEALTILADNMDYTFTYNSDGIKILDTEIVDVSFL